MKDKGEVEELLERLPTPAGKLEELNRVKQLEVEAEI